MKPKQIGKFLIGIVFFSLYELFLDGSGVGVILFVTGSANAIFCSVCREIRSERKLHSRVSGRYKQPRLYAQKLSHKGKHNAWSHTECAISKEYKEEIL